jgi:methionyl-tRNA formyltransferase
MRLVFAGTPEFARPCLQVLIDHPSVEVVGVYSQPDRPSGRGQKLTASPVKQLALEHAINVHTPLSLKSPEERERLSALRPDLMVVVAYGMILPRKILAIPRHGCWNVHASLLPRWRGAAPIQRAIEAGDTETGVALMQMEAGLDTGPVFFAQTCPIDPADTAESLHDRLSELGAHTLQQGITRLLANELAPPNAQASEGVTYAHKLEKSEAKLDFALPAIALANKVRAFNPFPIAECELFGERVQVHAASAIEASHNKPSGEALAIGKSGLDIACLNSVLRITAIKRVGGKGVISIADWLNARSDLRTLAQTLKP